MSEQSLGILRGYTVLLEDGTTGYIRYSDVLDPSDLEIGGIVCINCHKENGTPFTKHGVLQEILEEVRY